MAKIESVCLYGGALVDTNKVLDETMRDAHYAGLRQLTNDIIEKKLTMVYGGFHRGIMGELATTLCNAGGHVIGVMTEFLTGREGVNDHCSEMMIVPNMHHRKQTMFRLADAILVFPGGLGTLEETLEVITWKQIGLHDKPIIILNINGYWNSMVELFENIVRVGYAGERILSLYNVVNSVDEIWPVLDALPNPKIDPLAEHLYERV